MATLAIFLLYRIIPPFWIASRNTSIFVGSAAIAIALVITLLVNGDLKGASVYRTIGFLSYRPISAAVVWTSMYHEKGGPINYVLRRLV